MATLFYKCPYCGNVLAKVEDGGITPFCCGHEMIELYPGSADGSAEKHVPIIEPLESGDECRGVRVRVGAEPHPMTAVHHICFIYLETANGGQIQFLRPSGQDFDLRKAVAEFCTCKDPIVTAVYEYCNLHGLWKLELSKL